MGYKFLVLLDLGVSYVLGGNTVIGSDWSSWSASAELTHSQASPVNRRQAMGSESM